MKGLTKKAKVNPNSGKTVWWVKIGKPSLTGAAATEGTDPTARSSRATRISGTLAEYVNLIEDSRLFGDTSIDGTKEAIMKGLASDAAEVLDDTILAKALGGTNVIWAGSATHRSNVIEAHTATVRDIRKAVRLLQLSSVPRFSDGYYVGLIHPDIQLDIQSDSAWQDIVRYRDTVKYDIDGEVGRIYGVRFASAPRIPILLNSGSANTDIYRTLIFGPEFIGQSELGNLELTMNEPGKTTELGMYNAYGYRFVMSTERLNESCGVRLESNATVA